LDALLREGTGADRQRNSGRPTQAVADAVERFLA
jgi:hypothetical protein